MSRLDTILVKIDDVCDDLADVVCEVEELQDTMLSEEMMYRWVVLQEELEAKTSPIISYLDEFSERIQDEFARNAEVRKHDKMGL